MTGLGFRFSSQVYRTAPALHVLPVGEGGRAYEVQAHGEPQLGLLIGAAFRKLKGAAICMLWGSGLRM